MYQGSAGHFYSLKSKLTILRTVKFSVMKNRKLGRTESIHVVSHRNGQVKSFLSKKMIPHSRLFPNDASVKLYAYL